jgi:LDH2 family malate/lactate/ureidoglycolate dehydrogenase
MVEKRSAKSWGHTFIVINPNDLVDDFESKSASVIQAIKASGVSIRIPGARSLQTAEQRLKAGVMPIPTKIWESILNTAENGLPE